jgi:hypothetical protein
MYYERGLLHPFVDYDAVPAWLNSAVDPMDAQGQVRVSPFLAWAANLNFDYIPRPPGRLAHHSRWLNLCMRACAQSGHSLWVGWRKRPRLTSLPVAPARAAGFSPRP